MARLCINGALGRMGRMINDMAQENPEAEVVKLVDHSEHPELGLQIHGIKTSADKSGLDNVDAVIDFSLPESTMEMLAVCVKEKTPVIIGTTGFTDEQTAMVKEASKQIPVIFATNMSVAVNLFFKILKETASTLKGYEIEMCEGHHIHKKDAPSGTAKTLVDIINEEGYSVNYEDVAVIREVEIIGDHSIVFEGEFDKFEIKHHAKNRGIFADGTVKAGIWIPGKEPGLYNMQQVLFGEN